MPINLSFFKEIWQWQNTFTVILYIPGRRTLILAFGNNKMRVEL